MSVVLIAERAGVSIATVSRVMNNNARVNPQIVDKVRAAMSDLGIPLGRARGRASSGNGDGLPDGRMKTIALIAIGQQYYDWFQDPVIASVVAEVSRCAEENNLGVLLAEMLNPEQLCKVVSHGQVDGALVLMPSGLDARAADTLRKHVPVVRLMGAQSETAIIDQVAPDHMAVGFLAAEYLLSRGCTELAFMTLTPEWSLCKLRASGFTAAIDMQPGKVRTAAKAYFLTPTSPIGPSYSLPTVTRADWKEVMAEFKSRPTGMFVPRDAELPFIYRMLIDQGIQPGRDIEVVSCDNVETTLSSLVSRPVSIDLGLATIAHTAVRRLMAKMEKPDEPAVRVLINPSIINPLRAG